MPDAAHTVAIVGFGRSGTTWLSDIVSKSAGQALLFEPWHPEVLPASKALSYRSSYTETETVQLRAYLRGVIDKELPVPWLLRNHLPTAVHEADPELTADIWQHISVLGFKSIRAAMAPDWILANVAHQLVYIVRNPRAVVASIVRRANFWEYGWPDTYDLFVRNAFKHAGPDLDHIKDRLASRPYPDTDVEKIALMWAVTHAVALPKLEIAGVSVVYYEDLYREPFEWSRRVLDALGMEDRGILPTYLFTPAMTSMRTMHGQGALQTASGDPVPADFFWRETLSSADQDVVLGIAEDFGVGFYSTGVQPRRAVIS